MNDLPARTPRISEEKQAEIVRLAIRQVPKSAIARRLDVNRNTVNRVIRRTHATLRVVQDTEQERQEAIAVYREIQAEAWQRLDIGAYAPAPLLAEIRQAQQRIDSLLGLAVEDPDDPAAELARFKAIVAAVIRMEAPELAPAIAQRLLEQAKESRQPENVFILPAKDKPLDPEKD